MSISNYDPFDHAVLADPYPYYAFLRDRAPCYHVASRDMYVLSRYEDVRAALSDTQVFSSTQGVGYERRPVPMMIAYDPPQHTRLRQIIANRFTPRALEKWTPRIDAIAQALVDPLLDKAEVDLVDELAEPFPVQVIAEMMNVPVERRADFKRWSDSTVLALSGAVDLAPDQRAAVEQTINEFATYFYGVIQERAPHAAELDDLISLLLRASDDGAKLDEAEVLSFCVLLLVAGNETTTNLIGNLLAHTARVPDDWRRLGAEPNLVRSAIEESLRHEAPIQGFFRNTVSEVSVAGSSIPKDSKVMLLYAAANRDPQKYPAPDEFRLDRNPIDHIAFGFGPHTCLGAHLARVEMRALLSYLLPRVARIVPDGEPTRTRNALLRGYEQLPVRIQAA
ncbi:MAG TPA: cytochrome P450 [Polyangiales bacterium]|nr:cytochrome P450 [Polyangiales bacterium]